MNFRDYRLAAPCSSFVSRSLWPLPGTLNVAGGEGGKGSGINSKGRGIKCARLPPKGVERKTLRLTLKIVADVTLVRVPYAGKSTFLSAVKRVQPKIANVCFLSTCWYPNCNANYIFSYIYHCCFFLVPSLYLFTTVLQNLTVWVPPQVDNNQGDVCRMNGAGSEGLVLCVSQFFWKSYENKNILFGLGHLIFCFFQIWRTYQA